MIKLKGVSKYYHSKGIVSTGMLRIDLDMSLGEYVVITGESGSGKSTLLNVISGLDSYEEGEMFVCGEDTSAYTEEDYEKYRKKYISNIFQNFNLINSYTVYQNVALAMQLTGGRAGRRQREQINDVLKKVGLYRYRHSLASRLSGGQKQRVAIARALVRNTPVIVADEPTGNLDSKAAAAVLRLLKKVASDKLVVVVTHNYDQVESYATRKITMSDGRIIEDRRISPAPGEAAEAVGTDYDANLKRIRPLQKLRLALRNTFNIVPKFLLLTFIFIFTTFAVSGFYATMRKNSYDSTLNGYNWFFQDTSDRRIVLKKEDMSPFTDEDYEAIMALPNADHIVKEDLLLDRYVQCSGDSYYLYGMMLPAGSVPEELSYGRFPEDDTEMVISISPNYYLNDEETIEAIMNEDMYFYSNFDGSRITSAPVRVVGVAVRDDRDWYVRYYVAESVSAAVQSSVNYEFATVTTYVNGNELKGDPWNYQNKVMPAGWVPSGYVLVPEEWNYMFPEDYDYEAVGKSITIKVESLYYSDSRSFVIWDTYDKDSFASKTRLEDYSWQNGVIMINSADYNSFFTKGNYQISLFVTDPKQAHETKAALEMLGYDALYLKDTLRNYDGTWMIVQNIYNVIWSALLTVVLFFIDYSIIKLIMRSRNTYYSTIRMLGATRGDVRSLLFLDLFNVLNIAFALTVGAIYSVFRGYITVESTFVSDILTYLKASDYAVIYGVLFIICFVISRKYAKTLFTDSALSTLRQEA